MRQYKTELSIIFILLFIWEAEFFILDIWPQLKVQAKEKESELGLCPIQDTSPALYPIIFNEIAWMGTPTSSYDEWIELKNISTSTISLDNWQIIGKEITKIEPSIKISLANKTINTDDYFLLEKNSSNPTLENIRDEVYTGGNLLNNPNPNFELYLFNHNCQLIDFIQATSSWPAGDTAKKTMQRKTDLTWQTSEYPGGTPKAENKEPKPPPEEPPTTPENPEDTPNPIVPNLIINELLPNPSSNQEGEFIELKNLSDFEGILEGWKIGDEQKNYSFTTETVPAQGFFVLPHSKSKIFLNNDGDTIYLYYLYDNNQILQDSITYSGKIPKGESYNRQDDNTWTWSTTTTPGLQNIITTQDDSTNAIPNKSYPRHIWINEFSPNPKGKDAENEFIEIYNPGPAEIDLTNWQIDDQENKGSHPYTFPEKFIIKRGEYITLPYSQTKISLNNNGDWVRLLWPDGQAIDEVPYSDPPEGESYNKTNNGWRWSCTATPGEPNKIASDDECAASPEEETKNYSRALWINEFLPDPKGKDEEGEFIELQNRGGEEIDLTDWQIDDCENTGSRPHTFPENTKIKANSYLVLYYKETKISLNNNGDCVRLLNPAGQAIDEIEYGKAKEGQSYNRQNVDHWQWTDNPTPYKDNEFTQILAAENSITKNNQPSATTPKRQILPQTGPDMYFYFSPIFLFFFIPRTSPPRADGAGFRSTKPRREKMPARLA